MTELPKKYDHESKNGTVYEVTPLAFLKDVEGMPPIDKIEGGLQIRDVEGEQMIVAMKPRPLTEEEKAARKAERDKERVEMGEIKDKYKEALKIAKGRRKEEIKRINAGEISAIPAAVEEAFQKATADYDAVRGYRTLAQTQEAVAELQKAKKKAAQ